jgi:hypothetical protein
MRKSVKADACSGLREVAWPWRSSRGVLFAAYKINKSKMFLPLRFTFIYRYQLP